MKRVLFLCTGNCSAAGWPDPLNSIARPEPSAGGQLVTLSRRRKTSGRFLTHAAALKVPGHRGPGRRRRRPRKAAECDFSITKPDHRRGDRALGDGHEIVSRLAAAVPKFLARPRAWTTPSPRFAKLQRLIADLVERAGRARRRREEQAMDRERRRA